METPLCQRKGSESQLPRKKKERLGHGDLARSGKTSWRRSYTRTLKEAQDVWSKSRAEESFRNGGAHGRGGIEPSSLSLVRRVYCTGRELDDPNSVPRSATCYPFVYLCIILFSHLKMEIRLPTCPGLF